VLFNLVKSLSVQTLVAIQLSRPTVPSPIRQQLILIYLPQDAA
jgi:hypothetical protein